ncbi:ImmA/IrrE family metallo-endopeptidase [Eshraghiella crossota]|uniref:ImmA/IrrE family metallo-endopeptidase n=1 Tax=Eshraghiella crossota TaxID=45851 RepID=UPI003FD754E6
MISVNNQELFEQYYQREYDFNTNSLCEDEVDSIKALVKEKRVDYALAPIGEKIFGWITEQDTNIHFEAVDFDSDKIDGLLYIPQSGYDKAYIVLNSKKPLINQIFTTAHEYYHYVKDYAIIKKEPYICNFSALSSVNEKRASRFAAEFLLPEEALRAEKKVFKKRMPGKRNQEMFFEDYAIFSIYLTLKYQLPLKAVIYRLYEEHYIDKIDEYIQNYQFIKGVLQEVKVFHEQVDYLYNCKNPYIENNSLIYRQMKLVYDNGYASRDELVKDAEILELDKTLVEGFFDDINEEDIDEDDDIELARCLSDIWEG